MKNTYTRSNEDRTVRCLLDQGRTGATRPSMGYRRSCLVFITQDVNRDVIENTFHAFRQALPQAKESIT
ncbi:hypothetical protein OJHNALOF_01811 [Oceanimonas sp. MB9]|nr:hypothetical protein [Oceanimonas sp. MB9]